MNIQEAKQIKIADYLQSLGYSPVKQQGNCLWYKSPFRQETEASFKVNTDRNLWFDYGLGRGGNIIALAGVLYASDHVPYLFGKIAEQAPHIRPISFSFRQQASEPSFQHLEVGELTHPALLRYLQERGINIALAKAQCKELHFTHNGKPYFAIGFPNVAGGYEIRSRFFKGCVPPKDVSLVKAEGSPADVCSVFEGFMDFLSAATFGLEKGECLVLNSVANVEKAMRYLDGCGCIDCYLDHDAAGRRTLKTLKGHYGERVYDRSALYDGCKDLNEYLQLTTKKEQ